MNLNELTQILDAYHTFKCDDSPDTPSSSTQDTPTYDPPDTTCDDDTSSNSQDGE